MKHYLILTALLFVVSTNIYSQEQLQHKMKWFIGENGKFFTNKHLPVYIRLSHSPEEGAESHLLKSKVMPEYTNPMYFDSEGYNTIRSPWAVDTVTKHTVKPKQDIRFEVYADGLPPKSKILFTDAKKYVGKNRKIYYGKSLKVKLQARDALSGVDKIYYSINGSQYKAFDGVLTFEVSGDYIIKYYSVDNVGNVEKVKSSEFIVDLNPPTTMHTIKGNSVGNIISAKAYIILSSEDDMAGVSKIMYYFNDETPKLYTHAIPLSRLSEGNAKFGFFAIDNVGNSSNSNTEEAKIEGEKQEYSFVLDKSGPSANAEVIGDQYQEHHLFISDRSKIRLFANDTNTDIDQINYGINKNAKSNIYSEPFSLSHLSRGLLYVNFVATDKLGNMGANNILAVYLDNKAPISTVSIGQPKFNYENYLFISKRSNISIKSIDNDSKVKKIEYAINNEKFGENPNFNIETEGEQELSYKATDNVNNVEKEKSLSLIVDNNPPQIIAVHGIDSIGSKNKGGKLIPIYPSRTSLFLGANDNLSGVRKITYSINGNNETNYLTNSSISLGNLFTKEGFYAVLITASDKLGNTAKKTVEFFVQNNTTL